MRIPTCLVKTSIFLNFITCGPRGASLCARFYLHSEGGHQGAQLLRWTTDLVFFFDPQHCRKAFIQWKLRDLKNPPPVTDVTP